MNYLTTRAGLVLNEHFDFKIRGGCDLASIAASENEFLRVSV